MARKKREPISVEPVELEEKSDKEDWISRLPDEIIVHILSLLTVREAMPTNALSRRWRRMWTFMTCLDFDVQKRLNDMDLYQKDLDNRGYMRWVNDVLKAHQADAIERMRIRYDVYYEMADIDSWFHFALQKRAKKLELDFSTYRGSPQYYSFQHSLQLPSHPLGFPGYESLKDLKLSSVSVSGEFLEYFLSICPMLERFSVVASKSLVRLRIPGTSLHLKYLVIRDCLCMTKLEIYAQNLMSLTYCGPNISMPLKNLPHLTELFVGGGYCKFVIDNVPMFSRNLAQLEALGLDMHGIEKTTNFHHFPVLSHLKHLEVKLDALIEESLIGLTSLIKASPLLHKFALWLYCRPQGDRAVQVVEKNCSHENLKVVEFFGFVGRAIDLELAMYFIENAKALQKIIIDRRHVEEIGRAMQYKENRIKISARKHAKLLRKKLPKGGPVIIIH